MSADYSKQTDALCHSSCVPRPPRQRPRLPGYLALRPDDVTNPRIRREPYPTLCTGFFVIADPTSMSWTFGTVCNKPLGSSVYFDTACSPIDSRRFFHAGMRGRAWELHIFTLSPTPGVIPHMVGILYDTRTLMAHITAVGLVHCETK
jgi:hypothetical protein